MMMSKRVLGLAMLLLSTGAMAEPLNFACVTEFPTTSVIGYTEGKETTVAVIHHNGPKYMPVWSNIVVPNDLPIVHETANALYDLGSNLEFKVAASSCEMVDGLMFDCLYTGDATQTINGKKVRMWSAYSKLVSEKSAMTDFNYIDTRISLEIDKKTYHIPMRYSEHECVKMSFSELKNFLATKNIKL